MAGLVHLVLRALSPDPRLVFQVENLWRLEPKKVTEMDSYYMNIELYIYHISYMIHDVYIMYILFIL